MNLFGKLWSLLNAKERASARRQVALMLIGMVLEMMSIGIVLPAVTAMSAGSSAVSPVTRGLRQLLDGFSHPQIILAGLVAILGLYLVKTVFLLFAAWRQVTFVARIQARIARDLFAVYLAQPWTFHLQRNSATLIRNISEIPSFALACIAMLMAMTESLVLCGIVALLFWIEPAGALAVFVVTAIAAVILERLTRTRLTRWGQLFQHHNAAAYQHMLQGFGGIKELKLRGCEGNFVDKFSSHRDVQVLMQARHSLFSMIPRLWFEMIAVSALCGLMMVMAWEGRSTQAMIPVLGLFAAAAFRVLPAINRLASGLQSIRYSTATIETLVDELALGRPDADDHPAPKLMFQRELVVEDVSYRYPGTDREALADVSLSIPRGAAIGIVGGSGSGKSTLVDLILGLLSPAEGRITIDGANLQDCVRGWQRMVGYVPQSIYLCDDTIRRNIAFGVPDEEIDDAAVQRAIKAAQLADFVAKLPLGVESVVGEQGTSLSGGQRQRIGIARALYHDPEVIVLDEATSSLDPDTERGVMAAVNALHGTKTLLIIANRLITVSNCDMLYRIENGRLVQQGSFAEVVGS